ncbi:MAG: hypothetical protein HY713_05215 [candidate division NC10 bacterium]|nr:hypothetical protein [candidate division NC10 bacterium]
MAVRDGSKQPVFQMWLQGKPIREIEKRSSAKPESIRTWIREWERGHQKKWDIQVL